tara:strand:+ start:2109 stop:4097 length:1989 start_codon:yes stop_codon:yes gene_type:complete
MPKKIKILDSDRDDFIYGDPGITDIDFEAPVIDNENTQIIQRTQVTMDADIPLKAIFDFNATFLNHETTIIVPEDSELLYRSEGHKKGNFFSVESEYMFDSLSYNNFTRDFDEIQLPSIYLSKQDIFNMKEYDQYSHFGSTINKEKMINFRKKLEPFYNAPDSQTITKYRNFFFGKDYDLSIGSSNSSAFPYYTKINIALNNERITLDTLNSGDIMLYDKLVNDFILSTKTNYSFDISGGTSELEIVDLLDLIKNKSSALDNETKLLLPYQPKLSAISEASKRWAADSIMSKKILSHVRDFNDIYNLDQCKYEILFYKIEKYLGPTVVNKPSQVYYFNNVTENLMFLDSQVKLSGTYTYLAKACVLIHGSQYEHRLLEDNIAEGKRISVIETLIKPSPKLVEINLFEKVVHVSKTPPIPPGVHFINKSNANNQIKMILQLESGEFIAPLIAVKSEDSTVRQKLKPVKSDRRSPKYLFRHSAQTGRFEIFKSSFKILQHADFQTSFVAENRNGHPHVIITDNIAPNKKYYYFFRTIDDYGFFSNPSPVYEVELLKDSDSSKIIVNTVPLYDEGSVLSEPEQKFGQFFQISPAFNHTQLSRDGAPEDFETYKGKLNEYTLGSDVQARLWGTKFKFRITSNNTGKKIDFNVIFDISKEQSEENLN